MVGTEDDVPVLWNLVQADLSKLALESAASGGGTMYKQLIFHLIPAQFGEF